LRELSSRLLDLGFLISWKKSQILPSQDFLFLGEHYRTDLGLIFPPEEKFQSLCQKILIEIGKSCCSRQIREISWKPKKLGYGNKHPKGPVWWLTYLEEYKL
jgi:hypothetical protein